jgi:hypothetical protein
MRNINIAITFGIAAISTCLGLFSLLAGRSDFSTSAAATLSLISLALTSTAYFILVFISKSEKATAQLITLALYTASAVTSVLAGSSLGLIPYIMTSMNLNFIQSLDYVWPSLLICSSISVAAYIFAYLHIRRKNVQSTNIAGANA